MGLSISESAAERERVEQLKEKRSASRSEIRSQGRNESALLDTPMHPPPARNEPPTQEGPEEGDKFRKEPKWRHQMTLNFQEDIVEEGEKMPVITVNPPPEPKPLQYTEKVPKKEAEKPAQADRMERENSYSLPPVKKEVEEIRVSPAEESRHQAASKEFFEVSPAKLGVENLTENFSPSRPNRLLDDSSLGNSGSRTLTLKKTLPTLNDPFPLLEHRNLDVEFQNFDWGIPRAKVERQGSASKRLKPEASVVLISKFGKEEEAGPESAEKKWKTRRDLMKEIVNDRLETVDSFSLPTCNPTAGRALESIQQICS